MREADVQKSIVDYLMAVSPETLVFAVPNAAARRNGGRAANGVPGLRKGVWDLCLLLWDGRAAFIEVKNEKGQLSDDQIKFGFSLTARGFPKCVARSIEDVRQFLAFLGVETRESQR